MELKINYNDPLQHTFDATKIEVDGAAKLKSIVPSNELFYFNFNVDDFYGSKRGEKELTASANSAVTGGSLNIPNDEEVPLSESVAGASDFSLKLEIEPNFGAISTVRTFLRLISKNDNTQFRFYAANQGGGVSRVYLEIINGAGATVLSTILGTRAFASVERIELSLTNDADIGVYYGLDGVVSSFLTPIVGDLSDYDVVLGEVNEDNDFKVENFQFFTDVHFTSTYTDIYTEKFTYSQDEHSIRTSIPFLSDKFNAFDSQEDTKTVSSIGYQIIKNVTRFWHDLSNWVFTPLEELSVANTKAQLVANAATFPLEEGVGQSLEHVAILQSGDGYETPEIQSVTLDLRVFAESEDIERCLVEFQLVDDCGAPIEGEVVIESDDYLYGNALVGPPCKGDLNSDGKLAIYLIETETTGKTVTITFKYTDPVGNFPDEKSFAGVTIPNAASAKFNTLDGVIA